METTKTAVVCLGKSFNSDEERREYFRNELRRKLPELKKIEGFPIGEDEDIIALSDPPYYTACPNPWLKDFIKCWEEDKIKDKARKSGFQVNEPYASDVSEGKNNPIYNAHSYHTKVPHPAIMRYILHYTEPGDIVFDGFAGTGMTGVAAQMCGRNNESKHQIENEWKELYGITPKWGERKSICGDLSPLASIISYNYTFSKDIDGFVSESLKLLDDLESEIGWVYRTMHTNGKYGRVVHCIWSDVFLCPNCSEDFVFWEVAIDYSLEEVKEEFKCPHCSAVLSRKKVEKDVSTYYDPVLGSIGRKAKSVVVSIVYEYGGKRFQKKPDVEDLQIINDLQQVSNETWVPVEPMMGIGERWGDSWRSGYHLGMTHVHHFFNPRSLLVFSKFRSGATLQNIWLLTATLEGASKLNRERPFGLPSKLSGTLYVSSLIREINVIDFIRRKINRFVEAVKFRPSKSTVNYIGSASHLQIDENSIDYIFTDPPFGSNLMYSELNFVSESWLKVKTNNADEAIENKSQNKSISKYHDIMTSCFKEYFRILKPGKWITVEFSNTSAAVWNGIQTSLQKAGFVIANVSGLDKKQGSFKAVTNPTSVKQDLVISCYKPAHNITLELMTSNASPILWDFVNDHMNHLPVHLKKQDSTTSIIERSPKILYDRLITFYLMRGLPVPIDARDFQSGLRQKFLERDGMYFTAEQAAEYDERKQKAPRFVQLSLIVANESDAVEWLKDRLRRTPQKYQDIMSDFRIATQSLRKGDVLPELQDILNENFIQNNDGKWRVPDLNETKDREALRLKALFKEYNSYLQKISQPKAKKMKEVRVEALRVGFKHSWEQKDFLSIIKLGDMIPQNILLEDEQLLMYYDIAKDRI